MVEEVSAWTKVTTKVDEHELYLTQSHAYTHLNPLSNDAPSRKCASTLSPSRLSAFQ